MGVPPAEAPASAGMTLGDARNDMNCQIIPCIEIYKCAFQFNHQQIHICRLIPYLPVSMCYYSLRENDGYG